MSSNSYKPLLQSFVVHHEFTSMQHLWYVSNGCQSITWLWRLLTTTFVSLQVIGFCNEYIAWLKLVVAQINCSDFLVCMLTKTQAQTTLWPSEFHTLRIFSRSGNDHTLANMITAFAQVCSTHLKTVLSLPFLLIRCCTTKCYLKYTICFALIMLQGPANYKLQGHIYLDCILA